jgi:hypothetical protein
MYWGFVLKCQRAKPYAAMEAAKLKTEMVVRIFVFCALSFGIKELYRLMTVMLNITVMAMAT